MKRPPKTSAKLFVLENNEPISAETEAIQSRIRQRAFELSHVRPQDAHSLYDWIMAESQVITVPPMELVEKQEKFELKFAVAGANAADVDVMVTPDQILLKSEYSHQHDADVGTIHVCDFKSTTVFRTVVLPEPIDPTTVKVDCKDGMVMVSASKKSAERPSSRGAASTRRPAAKKKS